MIDIIGAMRVLSEELKERIDDYNEDHNGLYALRAALEATVDRLVEESREQP